MNLIKYGFSSNTQFSSLYIPDSLMYLLKVILNLWHPVETALFQENAVESGNELDVIDGVGDFTVLKVIFLFMFTVFEWNWGVRKEGNFLHIGNVLFIYLRANILSSTGVVIDSDCFLQKTVLEPH